MFTNARKFYIESVLPSYDDFIEHRASNDWGENQLLRKGIIAASALFHLREHIPIEIQPSKNSLKSRCPDYGIIGDITNVSKHQNISRDNPQITKASQIYENLRLIMFKDEMGTYFAPQLEVYVKLDNGTEIKLINILYTVMSMWRDVLDELNIIKEDQLKPLTVDALISRDEANIRGANMQVREGEDYQFGFRMQKYNYEKNIIEPMDASEMDVEIQIHQLPKTATVHFQVTDPALGVNLGLDFDIPLSEEQAQKYIKLDDEGGQKENFLKEIIETSPEVKKDIQSKMQIAINAQKNNLL